jgi:hypothetical protein
MINWIKKILKKKNIIPNRYSFIGNSRIDGVPIYKNMNGEVFKFLNDSTLPITYVISNSTSEEDILDYSNFKKIKGYE